MPLHLPPSYTISNFLRGDWGCQMPRSGLQGDLPPQGGPQEIVLGSKELYCGILRMEDKKCKVMEICLYLMINRGGKGSLWRNFFYG